MYCDCVSNSLAASVDLKRTGKWVAGLPKFSPSGTAEEQPYWRREEVQEFLSESSPKKPTLLLRWWTMVLDLITDQIAMKTVTTKSPRKGWERGLVCNHKKQLIALRWISSTLFLDEKVLVSHVYIRGFVCPAWGGVMENCWTSISLFVVFLGGAPSTWSWS